MLVQHTGTRCIQPIALHRGQTDKHCVRSLVLILLWRDKLSGTHAAVDADNCHEHVLDLVPTMEA